MLDPVIEAAKPMDEPSGQIFSPGQHLDAIHMGVAGANTLAGGHGFVGTQMIHAPGNPLLGARFPSQPKTEMPRDFDPGRGISEIHTGTAGVNSLAADQPTDESHAHNRSGNTLGSGPSTAATQLGRARANTLTPGQVGRATQSAIAGESYQATQPKGSK